APVAAPAALSREDCLADLSELARRAALEWSYADDKREHFGVDLERLRAQAEQSLSGQPTLAEFDESLRRFVAGMKDGHAGVELPGLPESRLRVWPFTVADAVEGILVDAVAEGTPDLKPGDLLLSADRRPIESVIADAMALTSASTDGARRVLALSAMRRTDAPTVRCILQRPAGPLMELELATLPAEPGLAAPERPPRETAHRRLEGDIGYLRIGHFVAPDAAAWATATPEQRPALIEPLVAPFRQAFAELADTRALILDLRGNPGGTDLAGMEVARHLLPPGATYFQLQGRLEDGEWATISQHGFPPEPGVPRYERPLVVLIDERTFSTADNLSACLRDHLPEARFVGRPTGGGTGAPRPITLPRSGASVTFCTQRVYGPAGTLTEGRGTTPDVAVRWTREDLLTGADPDLAASLALLGPAER
ncbi:MAG TPA: S41 family peptidase, partial [Planctomycetota bacterium]|nr:S41 family peptidase [Planctomycetota bacterium]